MTHELLPLPPTAGMALADDMERADVTLVLLLDRLLRPAPVVVRLPLLG